MAITRPTFYPNPWAADQSDPPLSPSEMAQGYPPGNEKPSRQSINGVLNYSTNAILYYLIRGLPEWMADVPYLQNAVVAMGTQYFMAITANQNQNPSTSPAFWQPLPFTKAELDATFMTQTQADARYALATDVVTNTNLATVLATYMTRTEAETDLVTTAQADELFLTKTDAAATYLTKASAAAIYLPLKDAGVSVYRSTQIYPGGVLVLDIATNIVYQSLRDDNLGNALTDNNWWVQWWATVFDDVDNGLLLRLIERSGVGTYTINTSDLDPTAFDNHPAGIYMKLILKASGGRGFGAPNNCGGGGGEGATLEYILARMTPGMFPLTININEPRPSSDGWDGFWGPNTISEAIFADGLRIFAASGSNAFYTDDGRHWAGFGGSSPVDNSHQVGAPRITPSGIENPGIHYVSNTFMNGADGRMPFWNTRGGDGGGPWGGRGSMLNQDDARKAGPGCGGGGWGNWGRDSDFGEGFCLIYY